MSDSLCEVTRKRGDILFRIVSMHDFGLYRTFCTQKMRTGIRFKKYSSCLEADMCRSQNAAEK